jgi:beta-glucosidase
MDQRPIFRTTKKHHLLIMIAAVIMFLPERSNAQFYLDTTATIDARVDSLLSKMTLNEKIGQMVQEQYSTLGIPSDIQTYCLGSVLAAADDGTPGHTAEAWANLCDSLQSYALKTRLGVPLLIGFDAIHGTGSIYGATLFPHNIGMGCTRNPELLTQATQITAQEAAATGFNWTFSPIVAVARNQNWGRTYESYSEDPNVVREMSGAAVLGYQGDTSAKNLTILACAKHFIGDGGTTGGIDGGNTQVDEATLRAIHLPGYLAAIQQKVGSMMVSFSSWNGVPCVADKYLLTTLLKGELQFKGLLITDMDGILGAPGPIYSGEQFSNAINAGIDMAMFGVQGQPYPKFIDSVRARVGQGTIPLDRIDDAVRRILTQKFRLGLFEHPYAKRSLLSQVGSQERRQVARECVRQSLVLLKKKDGVLPISKNIKHIHMTGLHADNMGYQCGGWTITWQGGSGNTAIGTTIMQAVQQAAPNASVTYSTDGSGADSADIGIAVIGEPPYAEGNGILSLYPQEIQPVRNLKSYNIPVIVIIISGRPMILDPILSTSDAVIAAWLPGPEGEGITDVLFGDYQPTGILSRRWPKDISQYVMDVGDTNYHPLFPFGYGITSLSNSLAGSPPEVYSISVSTASIHKMEISFNKKMTAPPAAPGGFSVLANGTTLMNITNMGLKNNDSTTIILTIDSNLVKGITYTVSYSPGSVHSYDGGQLSAFENAQIYNILNEYSYVHTIPKKIEAEECFAHQNLIISACSDNGVGKCLASINNGSWADYYVEVPQSGKYMVNYRISSIADTGQIQLITNGNVLSTSHVSMTGSYSTWETDSTIISLSEGSQIIRMYASHGGFHLNWMQFSLSSTGFKQQATMPQSFQLFQNYPNPFNPSTTIQYALPTRSRVKLRIYNVLGQVVTDLINTKQSAGWNQAVWNANVSSGLYFYRLEATSLDNPSKRFVETKKMLLLR